LERTTLSEHESATEVAHKLSNADETAAEDGVVELPGANAAVAFERAERQPVRLLSSLRDCKNVVQSAEIPLGIRGFAVEFW